MPSNDLSFAKKLVQKRTILFGECDPAGVMYTPRIVECVVEAALKFISDSLGQPFERYMFDQNLTLPARNIDIDFLRPLTWDDEIEIRAGLVEFRTHAYTVLVVASNSDGDTAFTGKITQVCVDKSTKKISEVPHDFREALLKTT